MVNTSLKLKEREKMLEFAHWNIPNILEYTSVRSITSEGFFRGDEEIPSALLDVITNPDYFYFVCRSWLNIELLPLQAAMLKELWIRPFPMLIASRGFGKSFILAVYCVLRMLLTPGAKIVICGAAFRQAKVIFEYMATIWRNAPLLRSICGEKDRTQGPHTSIDMCSFRIGQSIALCIPLGDGCLSPDTLTTYDDCFSTIDRFHDEKISEKHILDRKVKIWGNGKFRCSDESYCNGIVEIKRITTRKGYSFGSTFNHRMKIIRNGKIDWVRADQMTVGDKILIDRSVRWHHGNFNCTTDQAYALGCMIGDGCWTDHYSLGYATQDEELIEAVEKGIGYKFSKCDQHHFRLRGKVKRNNWLNFWNLETCHGLNKILPSTILSATREKMTACLQGIFDTDGHIQVSTVKGGTGITVGLTNTSEKLIRQIQYILLHYGIVCTVVSRDRNEKWNTIFELLITGKDAKFFIEEIGFRLGRKQDRAIEALAAKKRTISTCDEIPSMLPAMIEFASHHKSKAASEHKYCNASTIKRYKTASRELVRSFVKAYESTNDSFLDELKQLDDPDIYYDEIVSIKNDESLTYDLHVPITHEYCANGFFSHNTKIRGLRAHYIICDEFASVPEAIYENVVAGFAAVSAAPVDNVKVLARRELRKSLGIWNDHDETKFQTRQGNQAILSGTAYYAFNHFARYWMRYKAIINSRGDRKILEEIFQGDLSENFNWRDYSVIRIPYEIIPKGFMDDKHVARSKATVHSGIYQMEYGACFATDSNGFFRRSLIESCVVKDVPPMYMESCGRVMFKASVRGSSSGRYVMAIDPASEHDNFSIVILELWPDHRRIVYCWTTTRNQHRERMKAMPEGEQDFYAFCCRKIRDLMKVFPCERIALDSQGGGFSIEEGLHDKDKIMPGERPIWPTIDPEIEKPTDGMEGLHILEIINFASADWVLASNHGMRKDFEDRILLFPFFDAVSLSEAAEDDKYRNRIYDTMEDCVMEIEELKDELATIVHSQTPNGRDRWDTPETKLPGGRKGRQRKDRYSALLMANMIGRQLMRKVEETRLPSFGGWAHRLAETAREQQEAGNGNLYSGPDDIVGGLNDFYRSIRH